MLHPGDSLDSVHCHSNNRDMAEEPSAAPRDIRVEFSSWISTGDGAAATRTIIVPSGTTLGPFLPRLAVESGMDLAVATASAGNAFIAINDACCVLPRDLDRVLLDGDVVRVMPFIAGG